MVDKRCNLVSLKSCLGWETALNSLLLEVYMERIESKKIDSGISCLMVIAAYYGIAVDEDKIRYENNLMDKEAGLNDILLIAKKINLKAKHVKFSLEKLIDVTLPAIIKLSDGSFAILLNINTEKALVLFAQDRAPHMI